jgi:hypothetical protein
LQNDASVGLDSSMAHHRPLFYAGLTHAGCKAVRATCRVARAPLKVFCGTCVLRRNPALDPRGLSYSALVPWATVTLSGDPSREGRRINIAVCDILCRVCKELGLAVVREPSFPVQAPGAEGRRPDLLLKDWEGRKDLYVDVVGSSSLAVSNMEGFVPGGASRRAVARKKGSYRDVLRAQPPSVTYSSFSFE